MSAIIVRPSRLLLVKIVPTKSPGNVTSTISTHWGRFCTSCLLGDLPITRQRSWRSFNRCVFRIRFRPASCKRTYLATWKPSALSAYRVIRSAASSSDAPNKQTSGIYGQLIGPKSNHRRTACCSEFKRRQRIFCLLHQRQIVRASADRRVGEGCFGKSKDFLLLVFRF